MRGAHSIHVGTSQLLCQRRIWPFGAESISGMIELSKSTVSNCWIEMGPFGYIGSDGVPRDLNNTLNGDR
jgi:hypothetical protein